MTTDVVGNVVHCKETKYDESTENSKQWQESFIWFAWNVDSMFNRNG